ncbi:hypothetical protein ONR57_13425 [Hoyosella sp. YIM 151337]|uniref:LmeA family phospholipid-binding protein n=1 Tax=Hoyosella sp. YIM 151337 TaxID=2992742 RepID=UPI002235E00C|nr:hypothetical protein [Hoyosella sp. YIM 151337]MCW4354302.1 hypothetical protein [Hoyosella sp. YIM 151337]
MRTLIRLVVGLLILAVVAVAAGEAGARYFVGREVTEPLAANWQTPVSSSFGTQLLLPALFDDRVGEMSIESDTIQAGSLSGSSVTATLDNVDIKDRSNPVAQRVNVTVSVSNRTIFNAIEAQGGGGVQLPLGVVLTIDDVRARPDRGALEVVLGGGVASVFVTPLVVNGEVVTETDGGEVLGFAIPDEIFSAVRGGTQESVAALPNGLRAESVEVTENGVDVHLAGESLPLGELNGAQ